MKDNLKNYELIRKRINAFSFSSFLAYWDSETEAPLECFSNRSKQIGILNELAYNLKTSKETISIINILYKNRHKLNQQLNHEICEFKRDLLTMKKIPINEYIAYQELLAYSFNIWLKAKKENNFLFFLPTLEKIVNYNKQFIKYQETKSLKGYDVLLNRYVNGFKIKDYDKLFLELKETLVPFIYEVSKQKLPYNDNFLNFQYSKEKQKQFINYLHSVLQFDTSRGLTKESEHPFTISFGPSDVRYSNHFYEDNLCSGIFAALHELGHALYEQQVSLDLEDTLSWGGGSMALHESQSLFYEQMIGRSKAFWNQHFPVLKSIFKKEFKGVTIKDFYHHINTVKPSLIRIEADELTYPIHIMIRYDIEKALFANQITVKDLPIIWKEKIKEYLNIDVPSDKEGILQDMHWAGGMFGYFPTYALGAAYAAQIFNTMNKEFNVYSSLKNKNTEEINYWLKINLHQYGSTKDPKSLFKHVAKENFNPKYYVKYLKNKYTKIYNSKN